MASSLSDRVNSAAGHFTVRHLVLTAASLLVLTGLSWGLAHVDLGAANTPVGLGIAVLKASIVALVFMELAHGSTAQRGVIITTGVLIVLLAAGMVTDIALR